MYLNEYVAEYNLFIVSFITLTVVDGMHLCWTML